MRWVRKICIVFYCNYEQIRIGISLIRLYLSHTTETCWMKERSSMKHKQWIFVTVVALLSMMSCSLNICGYRQGYAREQLSDANWIAQAGDTYTFWRREGSVLPESAALHFSRFFGRETLLTIDVQKEGYIHVLCSLHSPQGPFEVVLVQPSTKQVIRIAKQQGTVQRDYYLEKGTYTIKILGYDASGSVALTLKYPHGITARVSTMRL